MCLLLWEFTARLLQPVVACPQDHLCNQRYIGTVRGLLDQSVPAIENGLKHPISFDFIKTLLSIPIPVAGGVAQAISDDSTSAASGNPHRSSFCIFATVPCGHADSLAR